MAAAQPLSDVAMPASVVALSRGSSLRPVWQNEAGGLWFELDGPVGRRFVKWTPPSSGIDLDQEVVRLGWAARFTPVPQVVAGSSRRGWSVNAVLAQSWSCRKPTI